VQKEKESSKQQAASNKLQATSSGSLRDPDFLKQNKI